MLFFYSIAVILNVLASRVVGKQLHVSFGSGALRRGSQQRFEHDEGVADFRILNWGGGSNAAQRVYDCETSRCEVTSNRSHLPSSDAVYWDITDLNLTDMPPSREREQLWVAQMEESPCIYDVVRSPEFMSYFSIGVGMSEQANVRRCPHVHDKFLNHLAATPMNTVDKDAFRRNGTGLVAYIQGNCLHRRDALVEALEAEGIQVDALGDCLHNSDLPSKFHQRSTMDTDDFLQFERRYKFAIAVENCKCQDYVTEKLFRRLHEGIVPIYELGPGAGSWLPDSHSIIDPSAFSSVKELAKELKRLDANATAYEEFLAWKNKDLRSTKLAQQLQQCTNSYQHFQKQDNDAQYWCPICNEVMKQRSNPAGVKSLAKTRPFGVCPAENVTLKNSKLLNSFIAHGLPLTYVIAEPSASTTRVPESALPHALKMWKNVYGPRMQVEIEEKFPSRPPRRTWLGRLRHSVDAAASNPCGADLLVGAFDWPFGFGSRFNNVVNGLWVAMYQNLSVAVCDSEWGERVWETHFDNSLRLSICRSCPAEFAMQEAFVMPCFGGGPAQSLAHVDHEYIADLKRFITSSVFTYNEGTHVSVQSKLDSLQLSHTRYLGVHIRRGDKREEALSVATERYAAEARTFLGVAASSFLMVNRTHERSLALMGRLATEVRLSLRVHRLHVVYVASDDAAVSEDLQRRLGGLAEVRQQPRMGISNYATTAVGKNDAATVALLTDIEVLRRADVFIGTASSNLGRLVYFLRHSQNTSVSLDDGGDFLRTGC